VFRTIALVVIVVALMQAAYASSCMTESEARRAYATSHLYWHGADHCWDATPGRVHTSEGPHHHFVRHHREENEAVKAQPRRILQAQPSPSAQPQLVAQAHVQMVAQAEPQPMEESALMPVLTTADLIRAGNTRIFEELESKLKERWSDTHMEVQTKASLIASATADAESTVSVGLVILGVGGAVVICTMLISFGATMARRRHQRQM
jgi:hypothetical protein